MADFTPRIRQHRERQERLEYSAEQARAALAQRRKVPDDVNTIAAYAKDMRDFLKESDLTERRAFIKSFVKEIVVMPGDTLLRYTVPMPDDSLIPGRAAEKVALNGSVLSTLSGGGADGTEIGRVRGVFVSLSSENVLANWPAEMSHSLHGECDIESQRTGETSSSEQSAG